ncbi:MAG TPA: prepilin-type N-terminal cleavage/methylation domain-containing protein [Planctomycetota bacterium]|nr:prepilin-type N-terminal cleavage/methylation domain-containing protein [Planctomycetota bacterium]
MRQPRHIRAFTLVELLVVIGVISIIMSIGVGAYISMNKDLAWQAAVTTVSSLLTACRNDATADRAPTSLVIVTEPVPDERDMPPGMALCKEIYAVRLRRVGTWHFEPLEKSGEADLATALTGAFGQTADATGMDETSLVDGKYGKALDFLRWIEAAGAVDEALPAPQLTCAKIPAYNIREGIRISAWVRPELAPQSISDPGLLTYVIAAKPAAAGQAGVGDGEPVYSLKLALDSGAQLFRLVGGVRLDESRTFETCTPPMIRPSEWTHVAMLYVPGDYVKLFVNDEPLTPQHGIEHLPDESAKPPGDGLIRRSGESLLIGSDGTNGFHGTIDELTIDAITTSDRRTIPGNVLVKVENCPTNGNVHRIAFDRSGRLDAGPGGNLPLITICSTGSPVATMINVEKSGALRMWQATRSR